MEGVINSISDTLQGWGIAKEFVIFFISLLPILELRGGMIAAKLLSVPLLRALPFCIAANLIPIPFIIFFIRPILAFLQKHGPLKRFANWVVNKGNKHGTRLQEKYPKGLGLGLFLFVAIPLPGTGAWTGSLVAALLHLKPKKSIPFLMLGVLGCSVVMTIIAYLMPALIGL